MISPTLLMASGAEESQSNDTNTFSPSKNAKQCNICQESFGKIINRPTICFKCQNYVCSSHSTQERYNSIKNKLESICDDCIEYERKITIKTRLKNIKLKYDETNGCGTFIHKIDPNSKEYQKYGLRNRAKIIKIVDKNVESFDARTIANTLNTIDIPFDITLDFILCDDNDHNPFASHYHLTRVSLKRRHSIPTTIGYGAPISDQEMKEIVQDMLKTDTNNNKQVFLLHFRYILIIVVVMLFIFFLKFCCVSPVIYMDIE